MNWRRLRCRLAYLLDNALDLGFWRGAYTHSEHWWPYPPLWTEPRPSPDPEWPGLVEYEVLDCPRCGYRAEGPSWRPFYGVTA